MVILKDELQSLGEKRMEEKRIAFELNTKQAFLSISKETGKPGLRLASNRNHNKACR